MNKRIIVVGIVRAGNKILLGRKAKGRPPYPDAWHTLGGGVEDFLRAEKLLNNNKLDDDYFHQELQRELREEANILVDNIKNICPQYCRFPRTDITENKNLEKTEYIFLEYFCDLKSDLAESKPGDDIAELQWVDKGSLKNIKLTPPSKKMYNELGWI